MPELPELPRPEELPPVRRPETTPGDEPRDDPEPEMLEDDSREDVGREEPLGLR